MIHSPLVSVVAGVLIGTYLAPHAPQHTAAIAFVLCITFAAYLQSSRKRGAGVVLLLAALLAGALLGSPFASEIPRRVDDPQVRLVRGVVRRGCTQHEDRQRCVVREDGAEDELLLLSVGVSCHAKPGDILEVIATITPLYPTMNEGLVGPNGALVRRHILATGRGEQCEIVGRSWDAWLLLRRAALGLRRVFEEGIDRSFTGENRSRARSLLFGDAEGIDEGVLQDFRRTGLSHLLAVSGAHVALLAAVLQWVCRRLVRQSRWILTRGRAQAVVVLGPLPLLSAFVMATGEAPSAVRALVMALVTAFAVVSGRRPDARLVLASSVLLTLMLEPNWRFDVGWQLSIAASWALVSAQRGDKPDGEKSKETEKNQRVHAFISSIGASLVATLRVSVLTLPIVARMSGEVPVGALVANVVAAPFAEALLLPGVLAVAMLSVLSVTAASVLAKLVGLGLSALFAIPSWAVRVPLASVEVLSPTDGQSFVWLLVLSVGLLFRYRKSWIFLVVACACVLALEVRHRAWCHPTGVLRLTVIDVGQGDALLLDLPDGSALLMDAGGVVRGADPGSRIVVPFLAHRRRRRLSVVVASHPHPDHVNGLRAVFQWAQIGALWDTRQSELEPELAQWKRTRDGAIASRVIPLLGPESLCDQRSLLPRSGALVRVLSPCPSVVQNTPPNDASFVLRVDYGEGSVLLPGDLEESGEEALLSVLKPVTVLKLGHHGSRTSSTERWLDALAPKVGVVSAGHPSPFHHPHAQIVSRFARRGISLWSTGVYGALRITLDYQGRYTVETDAIE